MKKTDESINEVIKEPEDPRKKYSDKDFKKQQQLKPGIQQKMTPVPDCGEESYKGHGRLAGRKALITGGDSGIGRAVAIAYAREGAQVAINYLPVEESDAGSLMELLKEENIGIALLSGDIRYEEFCRTLIEQSVEELSGLDILVLNAGTQTALAEIEELSTRQLFDTYTVNVFSMYWLVKAALPHMKAGTSIITTSSIQGFKPSPKLIDYAATKYAVIGFTRSLAQQLAERGIRVNSVAPGPIWTALQVTGGQLPEDLPEFGQHTPLGRAGQPAEVAGAYVFLASEEASYVTAEVYGVTGGNYTV